jgi:hypothetical protein
MRFSFGSDPSPKVGQLPAPVKTPGRDLGTGVFPQRESGHFDV